MKRKIRKILRNMAITVLILSCIVMPVNAEDGAANLEAVDYQEGMESLANVSEEEWLNSANTAAFSGRSNDKEFIRVENGRQTAQDFLKEHNIQEENTSAAFMKGISMIGNPIIEKAVSEETQMEDTINDMYLSGNINDMVLDKTNNLEDENLETDSMEQNDEADTIVTDSTIEDDMASEEVTEDIASESAISEQVESEKDSKEDSTEEESSNSMKVDFDEGIQELSAPEAGLQPYIMNEESLRDGMITTETIIAWIFTGDADIYYYGGFQTGYIIPLEEETGYFLTKFYTPGTYQVLCYGENKDGEESEMVEFSVTVISEFESQTIEDSVSSATDSKSYSVDIDFTDMSAAAVCIVRTGKSNVQFKVTDEGGNELKNISTTNKIPKRWVYIDKPSADAGVCHYTVTVSAKSYNQESGDYRIIIGDKEDTEAMMGGLENAVDIDVYRFSEGNSINSTYSPNNDEYWFITPMPYPTVFTLLSRDSHLRYKLLDMDTLNVLFDSNDARWAEMHSTRFTGSYSYAEKVIMKAFAGEKRYLVIYNNSPWSGTGVSEREFCFGAGQPMYGLEDEKVYGSSVSVNSSSYSSTKLYADTSYFPNTGVAYKAYLYGEPTGSMEGWRLKGPKSSSYQSSIGKTLIEFYFTPGGSFNTKVKGTWDLGIKLKSGRPSVTCTPSVNFMFYYEYGDDTITIDYKAE